MGDADCEMGSRCLGEFVRICEHLRVLVAMGPDAQTVAELARRDSDGRFPFPPIVPAPHPLIYGHGWEARQAKLDEALREAARLINGGQP